MKTRAPKPMNPMTYKIDAATYEEDRFYSHLEQERVTGHYDQEKRLLLWEKLVESDRRAGQGERTVTGQLSLIGIMIFGVGDRGTAGTSFSPGVPR